MEKIVAVKTNRGIKIAKLVAEITDSLRMKLLISKDESVNSDIAVYEFTKKFNQIIWEVKLERVFPEIDSYEGYERTQYIQECMESCFQKEIDELELPFDEVYGVSNLQRHFRSEDFIKLKQAECFDRMPIPEKTKSFISEYIKTIEEVSFTKSQLKNIYSKFAEPVKEAEELVIYIGENTKYRGCVGKVIDYRDDVAPNLIEFNNINGKTIKYWSKEENIVRFYV